MSGFQSFNTAGAKVVDSDFYGTYYRDSKVYSTISDTGYFEISTPLGNGTDMGFAINPFPYNNDLQWFKFNNNAKVIFGYPYMTANAGTMARTGYDVTTTSGYVDVFNAQGKLVWSAVTAAKIPRVTGFFEIPANYDLDNKAYSQSIGTNSWLLASDCPGNLNTDGTVSGYSGLFFKFSGGMLQAVWINRNQVSWANTLKPYGLKIPFAILPNL
ncbi:hypothetical protein [Pseudocitrobacter faecalis]|uniref:Uncharacterized protein n=1 Tax=Pseudocitrobacter faecalis TaxID=1398493 RepID=A0ABX9G255_9ENTR|nr:hypothetical protein DFQ50_10343 [Pseudocitrobacter faecalis]